MTALGAAIAFTAALVNAIALVLQAAEARDSPREESGRVRLLWRLAHRPRWLLGTLLLIIGWPLQVVALLFAPLTVVQPMLASFQLILLALVRFQLHARVGRSALLGALAITMGVVLVLLAAQHRTVAHPAGWRVAIPLVLIGIAALVAYADGRRGTPRGLVLAAGAGFAYAWADFANKLASNAMATGNAVAAVIWLIGVLVFGALAFLQENSALQCRSPVIVAPVIGALQEPLPVLMALAAGVEAWNLTILRVAAIAAGLALTAAGAATVAHSPAVARASTR